MVTHVPWLPMCRGYRYPCALHPLTTTDISIPWRLTPPLQRDSLQKAAFFRDLGGFWSQGFDDRLLRLRVLPAVLQVCEWAEPAA